jgi:hypothetical protein
MHQLVGTHILKSAPHAGPPSNHHKHIKKSMDRFDLLPKIADEYRVGTATGGCLSLLALITTILLALFEIGEFLHPSVIQILALDTRRPTGPDNHTISTEYQATLRITVQVTFPHVPCFLLHYDSLEGFTELPLPLDDSDITFTRLSKEGRPIGVLDSSVYQSTFAERCGSCYEAENVSKCCNSCKQVIDAYREAELVFPVLADVAQCRSVVELFEGMAGEGCEVAAGYSTVRMKSQFHISPGISTVIDGTHFHDPRPFGKDFLELNLTHRIDKLFFGEEPDIPGSLTNFTTVQEKVGYWQTVYTTDIIMDEYTADRYVIENSTRAFPGVVVKYDVSPLCGFLYYDQEGWLQLISRLVMLLGGVLFAYKMVDSALFVRNKHGRKVLG